MTQKRSAKLFLAATISLLLLATGCQKSEDTATDNSSSDSPSVSVNTDTQTDDGSKLDAPEATNESEPDTEQTQVSEQDSDRFFTALDTALTPEEREIHETVGNEKALNLATAACQDLNAGKPFTQVAEEVVQGLQEAGLEGDQLQQVAQYSGKVIGVGVGVFCPQHASQITEASNGDAPADQSSGQDTDRFFAALDTALTDDEKVIHQTVGDQKALDLANSACQELDQGKPFAQVAEEVVGGLQSAGLEGDELQQAAQYSGKVVGAGIAVFCPQHLDQLQG
ncbi:MAG: DUF732 domain-containing protein [Cyanobacteria bacterium CRU_2_1]|nr:DUF732 domain-containing protein [Cyanobacteria bacterium RU_5_0]NJR59770.1 DUF732 domain-containing protein [Cyanobacteria bacterium CRU_2_1]